MNLLEIGGGGKEFWGQISSSGKETVKIKM